MRFVHEQLPGRVVFGAGTLTQVPAEAEALGCARVLVIAGGSAAAVGSQLADAFGIRGAGHFDRVAQHVPESLAAEAREAVEYVRADGLCSVGGGSATGLAKAVAVERGLPVIAVPTTYAGSEATPVYGITGERKRTGRDLAALPRTIVYDPRLTTGLPPRATAASGFNALAHAVTVLGAPYGDATAALHAAAAAAPHAAGAAAAAPYAVGGATAVPQPPAGDPIAALHAEEAVRSLAGALPTAVRQPDNLDARGELLYGAYLAATGLASVGTGLHHRLCHALGGRCRLVHAEVHALLLPYTVAADETLTADGRRRLGRALGADDPVAGLRALADELGLPDSLAAIGTPADQLDAIAADAAEAAPGGHPRAGDQGWFRALLDDAYAGRPPRRHEAHHHEARHEAHHQGAHRAAHHYEAEEGTR